MPPLKVAIGTILSNPHGFEWSVQGLGMLRLYMPGDRRLHVWSGMARAEQVSDIHSHPWDFLSTVVAGEIRNQRFRRAADGEAHIAHELLCGPGGGLTGKSEPCALRAGEIEIYREGYRYYQRAAEIHRSDFAAGTVTMVHRIYKSGHSRDHALVFTPLGAEWGSAEPRAATADEVEEITSEALRNWWPA